MQETFHEVDITEVAKTIVKGVREVNLSSTRRQKYTLIHFMEVFRGKLTYLYTLYAHLHP